MLRRLISEHYALIFPTPEKYVFIDNVKILFYNKIDFYNG